MKSLSEFISESYNKTYVNDIVKALMEKEPFDFKKWEIGTIKDDYKKDDLIVTIEYNKKNGEHSTEYISIPRKFTKEEISDEMIDEIMKLNDYNVN